MTENQGKQNTNTQEEITSNYLNLTSINVKSKLEEETGLDILFLKKNSCDEVSEKVKKFL